jgi:hypothetical protein
MANSASPESNQEEQPTSETVEHSEIDSVIEQPDYKQAMEHSGLFKMSL